MNEPPPSLPADTLALLAVERDPPAAPHGARDRVRDHLYQTIATLPGPGGGGSDGDGGSGADGGGGASGAGAGSAGAAPGGAVGALRALAPYALTFALGAATATGVWLGVPRSDPPPRVVYVDRPTASEARATTSAPSRPDPAPSTEASAVPAPAASVSGPSAPSARSPDRQLALERARLDVARTALGRGDPTAAMAAIDQHARSYPNGLLVEEREAMAVQALIMAERNDEARARGRLFLQHFPNSVLRPTVSAALASIP